MQELWHPVLGFEGEYLVSNVGRVMCAHTGQIRRSQLLDNKYVAVCMNSKLLKVHHLVAEAFIGPRPDGLLCLHRDDDKFNNTPENLYWGTASQNQRDCHRNGHRKQDGANNNNAKLNPELVREIRAAVGSCRALGKKYGVDPMTISLVKRRKLWAECV